MIRRLLTRVRAQRGVSMVEVLMVVTIVLVLMAISFPAVARSVKLARLSTTASSVSNLIQRARYEAIRRNTNTLFRVVQQGSRWALYIDVDNSGTITTGDPELVLTNEVQIDTSTSPPAATSMGYSSATRFPDSSTSLYSIPFNSRGNVSFAMTPTTYVIYLSARDGSRYGFRAVAVLPSGKTKVWMAPTAGPWTAQ
jgi:prepilin-type N-terminal cleavage/methylation domain-containing protein